MQIDPAALTPVFQRYPVIAAYLFGSQATGATTPLSDVDIAVLLAPDAASPGEVQIMLTSDLMGVLRRNDVDVVVLNRAPALLRHRVVSRGRLLFCRDPAARAAFETAVLREYLDTAPLREAQDRALLDRYTNGR
jgi:hypothetical protein